MTTVLITGATRGLGLASAHAAAARGAHVLVAGRSPEAVRATATAVGGDPIVLDLERLADVQAVAEALPAVGIWARADDGDEAPGVAGRRRYTTSKLLNAATAAALARERPDVHVTCLDPGLMLGTGLSRQYPAVARRLTTLLAPALGMVLPFASTPRSSGRALAGLLLDVPAPAASGAYVDHRLRTLPASERARDASFQAEELRDSRALLGRALTPKTT